MRESSIKALIPLIEAQLDTSNSKLLNIEQRFTGVSTDSRTIKSGDCFFAISGECFVGADFVADAFAKGAACAVVCKDIKDSRALEKSILKVNDTIKALGDFAADYRRQMGFKVVAITGSVGKTTVRHITHHVLSQHYRLFQSPKNFNNYIGLPLTLLGANPDHQIVVAELGTSHPGEIAYLTRIARPDIAVVTNVHPAHLEGFGDLQAIAREKLSISEALQPDGILIVNADVIKLLNGNSLNYHPPITGHRFATFGKLDSCDFQATDIVFEASHSTFTLHKTHVSLPLPGPGNVENALAAWAVCSQFDLTAEDFAHALKTLSLVHMRAEIMQIGPLTVLNDCYNANPASMSNALDILTKLSDAKGRRRVFICGDMAELGPQAERLHTELGDSIPKAKVKLLLAVGEFAETVVQAATKKNACNINAVCFKDTATACDNLEKFIKDDDIILVKGSRVAKLEEVLKELKRLFTE